VAEMKMGRRAWHVQARSRDHFLLRDGARERAREVQAQFAQRDGEAVDELGRLASGRTWIFEPGGSVSMAYDAAYHQEPDDDHENLSEPLGFWIFFISDFHVVFQPVERNVEVEYGADADWAEVADEERLSDFLNLVDVSMDEEDEWQAAEQQNRNTQEDKSVYRDHRIVAE
jgi:hypothetical protein